MVYDYEKKHEYYVKNREKILAQVKEWEKKNRKHVNERSKQYLRKHCVFTINGPVYGLKRSYPQNGQCELCNRLTHLHYHHYDDENLMKGIWVCRSCHFFVEKLEKCPGILKRYLTLKKEVLNN